MQEQELLLKLRNKDQAAFKDFVESYKNKVLNSCYHFVHNKHDAEDIAQEVFIEVFLSINKFKGNSSFNTWLYRISVNKCLDFIRKKNRLKRMGTVLSIFGISKEDSESNLHDYKTPDKIMENNQQLELLLKYIDKLPENQRIAFTLCKIENMSYKEVADVMKTSIPAVESLLQRAKNNLQKKIIKF